MLDDMNSLDLDTPKAKTAYGLKVMLYVALSIFSGSILAGIPIVVIAIAAEALNDGTTPSWIMPLYGVLTLVGCCYSLGHAKERGGF